MRVDGGCVRFGLHAASNERRVSDANDAAWNVFVANGYDEVTLSNDGADELRKYLGLISTVIAATGLRFTLNTVNPSIGQERWITLTPENQSALLASLDIDTLEPTDEWEGSDGKTQELVDTLAATRGHFRFARVGHIPDFAFGQRAPQRRVSGAFFPFLHTYDGPNDGPLRDMLADYQVTDSIENGKDMLQVNCIVHAFEVAYRRGYEGITTEMVDDLKHRCRRREIPRIELKKFAISNDVNITLIETSRNEAGKLVIEHVRSIYSKGKAKIKIAVIGQHYVLHVRVPVHSYALKHYELLKHKQNWYQFRNARQRIETGRVGMWSFQLLDQIEKVRMTLETENIFATIWYDRVETYESLEYNESAVQPHKRNTKPQPFVDVVTFDIEQSTSMNSTTEECIEDMKALIRKRKNGERALEAILHNLEEDASPEEIKYRLQMECTHTPYLLCHKGLSSEDVKVLLGPDCGKEFIEEMTRRYGKPVSYEEPSLGGLPESTISPQVRALSAATVCDKPLERGIEVCVLNVPANVYAAFEKMGIQQMRDFKQGDPEWGEKEAREMLRIKKAFCALPHERIGDTVNVLETYEFSERGFRGRLVSDGACNIRSAVRSNLLSNCADLDMACCAPTVITWLCGRVNIPCPVTRDLVANKEAFRLRVSQEMGVHVSIAKELINKVYFNHRPCLSSSATLCALAAEAKRIRDALYVVPHHAWVVRSVETDSSVDKDNVKGSFLARLYQFVENVLLLTAKNALMDAQIHVRCLMYDGLAIDKEHFGCARMLEIVENACEALLPTLGMKWAFKPLSFEVRDTTSRLPIGTFDLRGAPDVPIKKVRSDAPRICLCAHSATYDWSALINHFNGEINFCERRTNIICGYASHSLELEDEQVLTLRFDFKDTLKLIPKKLKAFSKMFALPDEKDVCPHGWYTNANVCKRYAKPKDVRPFCDSESDFQYMCAQMPRLGLVQPDGKWDMIGWSVHYCKKDVILLEKGFDKFRSLVKAFCNLDPIDFPTLASLADQYMTDKGVYNGINSVGSIVQHFLARANTGGRCMLGKNERSKRRKMTDMDFTSLYPSAMAFFPGFLCGSPKVIDTAVHDRAFLAQVDGYFVDILVHSVERDLDIPICPIKSDGGCNWTNRLEEHVICVDKTTLEDLVSFHGITYTILRGYYYDEGRNTTVNTVIRGMFDERLKYKGEGNVGMAEVIKLFMNTSYGVLSMRPVETKTSYITRTDFNRFLNREYSSIKQVDQLNANRYRVEQYRSIDDHFNRIHCSAEVLSFSKRMMNRVTVLAQDLGIPISYTDTDSIHLPADKLDLLFDGYELRYGSDEDYVPLKGDLLGSMHPDLKFEGCFERDPVTGLLRETTSPAVGGNMAIVADLSIAVGKKIYLDKLVDTCGNVAYHSRLKGVPSTVLMRQVNLLVNDDPRLTGFGGDIEGMYNRLYQGLPVYFDLTLGGAACFKTLRTHQIASVRIIRKIHCPIEMEF